MWWWNDKTVCPHAHNADNLKKYIVALVFSHYFFFLSSIISTGGLQILLGVFITHQVGGSQIASPAGARAGFERASPACPFLAQSGQPAGFDRACTGIWAGPARASALEPAWAHTNPAWGPGGICLRTCCSLLYCQGSPVESRPGPMRATTGQMDYGPFDMTMGCHGPSPSGPQAGIDWASPW